MPDSKKLLVLMMDGANPFLIRSWAEDGTLPHIRGMLEAGLVAETRSVDGLLAATWPSFYTGCNPATHGMYWLDRLQPLMADHQHALEGDPDVLAELLEHTTKPVRPSCFYSARDGVVIE